MTSNRSLSPLMRRSKALASLESIPGTKQVRSRHLTELLVLTVYLSVVVVAFRGSQSLKSFLIDLQSVVSVQYKNVSGATVGLGFLKEWEALLPQVLPEVQKLMVQFPTYSVWVTGHSLGGAVATLCALDIKSVLNVDPNVYTYGAPRVGNKGFAQFYDLLVPNTFRIVNGHDLVPRVPIIALGFYHVSTEVWETPSECRYPQREQERRLTWL